MTKKQIEGVQAVEDLKELLNNKEYKGIMFDVVHVAKSGMSRVISVKVLMQNKKSKDFYLLHPNYLVAKATSHQLAGAFEGVRYSGCGFDAIHALADDIARCVGLRVADLKIIK